MAAASVAMLVAAGILVWRVTDTPRSDMSGGMDMRPVDTRGLGGQPLASQVRGRAREFAISVEPVGRTVLPNVTV